MKESEFSCRVANKDDIVSITDLMMISIEINMQEFLSPEQIEANKESMGVDLTLIEDGSYFVVEATKSEPKSLVGCGGWSKRRTLFGGKHTKGRDDSFSDPQKEPARIRAMYTHPDWTRRGIGTLLLQKGEQAAREAGFKEIELGSTIHDIHVDVFHRSSHDAIWDFWKNGAIDLDWRGDMFQYDPFAGRIPQ